MADDLQQALKAIDEVLSDRDLVDAETLLAVLLCECRILFCNVEVCGWVEDSFKVYFQETHTELKKRVGQDNLKDACSDVM